MSALELSPAWKTICVPGGEGTTMWTVSSASPDGPVQESRYVVVAVSSSPVSEPVVPLRPPGVTRQDDAFSELQLRWTATLAGIVSGPSTPSALRSAVAVGGSVPLHPMIRKRRLADTALGGRIVLDPV